MGWLAYLFQLYFVQGYFLNILLNYTFFILTQSCKIFSFSRFHHFKKRIHFISFPSKFIINLLFTNKLQILEKTVFRVTAKFLLIRFEGKKRKYRQFRVLIHICIMVLVARIFKNHIIFIHQVQSVHFQYC